MEAQFLDRLLILQDENARLRSRLQACERSQAVIQAEVTEYRRQAQNQQTQALLQAEQKRVAELARANEALQQRDRQLQCTHRLLSVVAQLTKDLLEAEEIEVAIPSALKSVGEAADMSRVLLILEHFDPVTQKLVHRVEYEWVAAGIVDHASVGMTVMNNDHFQILIHPLYAGKSVWRVIDELPDVTRWQLEQLHVQSTGVVPILIAGQYIGCIAFDDCYIPRQWSQQEIDVLTAAAKSIGAALHRKQLVNRLVEERIKAARDHAVELAKANQAMQRVLALTAKNAGLDSLSGNVLQAIAEQFDAPIVEWWETIDDTTVAKRLSCLHGQLLAGEKLQGHHGVPTFTVVPETLHLEPMTQRKRHVVIDDVEQLPYSREEIEKIRSWYVHHGTRKLLNLPVIVDNRSIGGLVIFLPEHRNFSQFQIEFGFAMARYLGLAVVVSTQAEKAKQAALAKLNEVIAREQEQAAHQQAAELSRVNTLLRKSLSRLSTEPNLNDVLGQLLIEVTRYVGAAVGHVFSYDAAQNALIMLLRVRDEQIFWTPAADEPSIFRSPISVSDTPIFTHLCDQPRLAVLNADQFAGRLWSGVAEWFAAEGYQATSCCVLTVGDRPFGLLAMAFPHPIAPRFVDEELILALTQQIALVMQLTTLAEANQEAALLEERNRMARDIHDTLAQSFTGILMQLEATKRKIDSAQVTVAQDHIARARNLAQAGLSEARRSVRALRPETLESNDLPDALFQLAQQMTDDTSVQISVEIYGNTYPLAYDVENNLLRMAQEALTNALRHAAPQTVHLQLHFMSDHIHLRIQDDGCGFDPRSHLGKGFGLVGMQERSQRINGEFNLTSTIGQGTEIVISIPV